MANPKSQVSSIDDAAQEPVEAKVLSTTRHDSDFSGAMEMLTIFSSADEGGSEAVFLQCNNSPYLVPRDVPCKVPTELVSGLRNMKVRNFSYGPNGEPTERSVMRYQFSSVPA